MWDILYLILFDVCFIICKTILGTKITIRYIEIEGYRYTCLHKTYNFARVMIVDQSTGLNKRFYLQAFLGRLVTLMLDLTKTK